MRKAPHSRWLPNVSRRTLAALLLTVPVAAPVAAWGQGFAGTAVVARGSATISVTGGVQTVNIPAGSQVNTINWTPTDTASSSAPIDFLPAGNTVSYVGSPRSASLYTVLNRIIPSDQTRTIAFNGTVNSSANTRVWFYSPGGLLIGSTASFNVGGLVLTTADPVTDANGNYLTTTSGTDSFSVAGVAGSTSAITIRPGASISALNAGQSNYIVAIAPQINQGGTIAVAGSVALVAAESASFAVDSRGLFNITVTSGTTVAPDAFVNSGSVGGPNSAASGSFQRVYMVAVPKNDAIAMSIAAGGSIGFAVADAANLDGSAIVLSAGSNIADSGSGNPVVPGRAGSGSADLLVNAGNYTSNIYAVSTDSATVTDPALSMSFASDLTVIAPTSEVFARAGTLSIGGDLTVTADNSVDGAARSALVGAASGTSLAIGANAASLGVNGGLIETANDALTGTGGQAVLQANGAVTIAGNALVGAAGFWGGSTQNDGFTPTQGGTAQVSVTGGGLGVGGGLTVTADGDGTGSYAALNTSGPGNAGASATGGSASVTVSGTSAVLTASNGIAVTADGISGMDGNGNGGNATGGSALIEADSSGTIGVGPNGAIRVVAEASGGALSPQFDLGNGGDSTGGTAQVIANAGTITVAGLSGMFASADASGGAAPAFSGSGGSATGGTALIAIRGASGTIATNTSGSTAASDFSSFVSAVATGANGVGNRSSGGNAVGGMATVQTTGANQSLTVDHGQGLIVTGDAIGGAGAGNGGGSATGGTAQLLSGGGSVAITNTTLLVAAGATGGADNAGAGGNAAGGTVRLAAAGGTLNANVVTTLGASATGGTGSSTGGNALGGNIFVDLGNNAFNFASGTAPVTLDASYAAGTGSTDPLTGIISTGTAGSAGGVLVSDLGSVDLAAPVSLAANTPLYVQAGGSIAVTGGIGETGTGAYLHLLADDLGTGAGTVTLATGAVNLPGSQIDIYYNPASLGTPSDFSAGISAGTATGYQLVDNIDQLQLAGSFLAQNFALGRNINASATQGWNGGAGFVPIGNADTPFSGNFDGLNHTITNLYINIPTGYAVGLFGYVDTSNNNVILRNTGLVTENITGQQLVGGLLGGAAPNPNSNQLIIQNDFSSGAVTGNDLVGGLVGGINLIYTPTGYGGSISGSHSDASVLATPLPNFTQGVGGLVGAASGVVMTNDFATGSVTGPADFGSVGGLIGFAGSISLTGAYATGPVAAGSGSAAVGGLIGQLDQGMSQDGTVTGGPSHVAIAYATGTVTADTGSSLVGGLVGLNNGSTIDQSWASSPVSAPGGGGVGGLVGGNTGTVSNSYWDIFSTGQVFSIGSNLGTVSAIASVTSDPAQISSSNYAFGSFAYGNFTAANWVYDNNDTRPVGAWEVPVAFFGTANIQSAHQVQLIDLNLNANYTVTQNIDMRGTGGTTDIWDTGGFMPLGGEITDPPFTGTLEGSGHVLSNLTMAPGGEISDVGLIQENDGTIRDLGLANIAITEGELFLPSGFTGHTGALAGVNAGQISDSFATGTITVNQTSSMTVAGGLVGFNANGDTVATSGSITRAYASVAVSGAAVAGGLVGDNEGAISETYANGPVSGALAGGLIGETINSVGPSIVTSYWDTQATGQSLACGSGVCTGTTGLTTAQMLQASSFPTFSIDTQGGQGLPWRQYEGLTTPLLEAFLTPITVRPNSVTVQYDAQVIDPGVTTYGALPSLIFGIAQVTGSAQNAGVTTVTYVGGLYSNQQGYDLIPATTSGTLVITPAPLTLAAVSDTRSYDATTASAGVVQVSGLFGTDNVTSLTQSFTSPNVLGTNGSTLVVNPGYLVNDGNAGNNYTVSLQGAQGTITPAALTLAAVSDTRSYDATTASAGVVQVSGLFGTDNVTSLTQSFTSPNVLGTNGSTLVVNPGYLVNDGNAGNNYTVSLQGAQGTITPAALTLAAVSDTRSYDATTASAGVVQVTGLFGTDNVTSLTQSFTSPNVLGTNGSTLVVNPGYLVNDGNAGNNYTVSLQGAQGTITPAALTLAAVSDTRSYDATTASAGVVQVSGLFGTDNVTSLTQSFTSPNVLGTNGSTLVVNPGYLVNDGNAGNNYTVSLQGAQGTITPAALTLAAVSDTRSYDATTASAGVVQVTGLFGTDNVTSLTQSFTSPNVLGTNGSTLVVNPGYLVNDGNAGNNYTVSLQGAQGTITPAALTLAAVSDTRSYDATTASAGVVQVSGLFGTDNVTSLTQGFTSPNVLGTNGSTLVVNPGYLVNDGNAGNNYTVSLQGAQGTITPAALTLAAVSDTRSYDATTASAGVVQVSGLFGTDNVTSLTQSFTSPNVLGTNGSTLVVNPGYLVNDGNAGNNYTVSLQSAQGTITPAALTLAAVSDTRLYNATPSSTGVVQVSGLFGTDTVTSLTQSFTSPNVLGTNGSTLVVGTGFTVNDGNGGGNYTINFQNAAGTISPAPLGIVYTAAATTSVYGATIAGLTGSVSALGLQGTDPLAAVTSGTAGFATTATGQSGVGSYAVTGSGIAGNSSNYTFSFVQAAGNASALTIVPRALTLTADPVARVYGGNNPASDTATAAATTATSGLVNGDSVSSETVTSPATAASGVGSYALNGSAAQFGAGLASNYAITYAPNRNGLSITPAPLTLTYTANPGSSIYGQAPAGLSGNIALAGLVNGDTAAAVTDGTALFTSPATATSNVGSYAINGSGVGLASSNYALTSVQAPGNATALTVNPAALSILYTANPASRAYGAANPSLSGGETATGLVNGDTLGSVTSGSAAFTTIADTASNVGSYAISGSGLAGSSANYTVDFAQAAGNATALTVTPAAVTITYTANPLSSIYGNLPRGLSGSESASGLVNNDTPGSVTSGSASYATSATGQSGVGSYAVTGSGLAGNSSNYSFSFVQAPGNAAALTITPRPITVTADPQQRAVGADNPPFTYVVAGPPGTTQALVNGDTLTGQLTSAASTASPAGQYDILQGSLAASTNYQLTYVGNILTLTGGTIPLANVINVIEVNLADQPVVSTPEQRRTQLEDALAAFYASLGLHPPQITQSMINDHLVTTPPPINEPVTSNGNSSLWSPGAP